MVISSISYSRIIFTIEWQSMTIEQVLEKLETIKNNLDSNGEWLNDYNINKVKQKITTLQTKIQNEGVTE